MALTRTDLEFARELDAQDELAPFRNRFVIEDPDLIYLDGNSLGRLPKQTAALRARGANKPRAVSTGTRPDAIQARPPPTTAIRRQ